MTIASTAMLEPVGEARIALESVAIKATLQGLMSTVAVTQTYRNHESVGIEAVYTFPLAVDAVLLELVVELNGIVMQGVVQPNTEAEENYEEAIVEGDSPILLQNPAPGLYTVNVGNILPGESAVVRFRYAQLHQWQGDCLRFHLPTTIAPRYGDPSAAGLSAHQAPEHAWVADFGFSLSCRIEGELAQAGFECPSHTVVVNQRDKATEIALSGGSALMDRDFVLVVKKPFMPGASLPVTGIWSEDHQGYVALASFNPVITHEVPKAPRCIKLVVDCSGSMGGDSIAQAKKALDEILSLLEPDDYFNLITFGSRYDLLFPEPVVATDVNIRRAAHYVRGIDANMGGTQIGEALEAAYLCGTLKGVSSDLLLITDGEVWDQDKIVNAAMNSEHRILSVGVGSAVSEAFVRAIAEKTSGACELVSPKENMSERIVRHFGRIDQPSAQSVQVQWPDAPVRQLPSGFSTVYSGDTLHVFGWFKEPPAGKVSLSMTLEDGQVISQQLSLSTEVIDNEAQAGCLPRVAAHSLLNTLDENAASELAVQYQLVTKYTSCFLVFNRSENSKAMDIPALRKVPQVLAAGWGGVGSFQVCANVSDIRCSSVAEMCMESVDDDLSMMKAESLNISPLSRRRTKQPIERLITGLNARYPDLSSASLDIKQVDELVTAGLDHDTADELLSLVADGHDEPCVIACFLMRLLEIESGKKLSRHVGRLIRKAAKKCTVTGELGDAVFELVERLD